MTRDQAIELARRAAVNDPECHLYTPKALSGLERWQPHAWVVEAILTAAEEARRDAITDLRGDLPVSPAHQPETTMTQLAPHQQRVVAERDELADRLGKLLVFLQGSVFPTLDAAEQVRLRSQARFMSGYEAVLEERIAALSAPIEGLVAGSLDPKVLVQRFLTWPVPADVCPDGTPGQPGRTGTNLLSAPHAAAMLRHVLGG